jgi:hypothetical protein
MQAEIHKNGTKKGQFPALFGLKIAKNSAFSPKYLIRQTPKMFLKNTLILKFFVTSGVVQSFGSHICPQPSGLGLTHYLQSELFNN